MFPAADFIVTNVRVFTSNEINPYAEAVAVKGNRIVYVGNRVEVENWRAAGTRVLDGQGNTLMPGFIDCHFHLLSGCVEIGGAQLQEVRNQSELSNALRDFAAENEATPWVVGHGIKYGIVSTRQELDAIIPDRLLYIGAYDGHTAWANTKALETAGILRGDNDPASNSIVVRDEAGIATGELREWAIDAVHDLVPEPNDKRKRELLSLGMKRISATGVTSVHNMNGDMKELKTYAEAEAAGEMLLRVYVPCCVAPENAEAMLVEASQMAEVRGDYARGGAVKFFMDGVWESYTALTLAPYADSPGVLSEGVWSLDDFTRIAAACDRMGLQIFVHACGDGAVRRTLDGYERVQTLNGKRDSRHRVEHVEVIHPDDMPRFEQLGVIASMQPLHSPTDVVEETDVWLSRVGARRWPLSFAWRDIKDSGAALVFGSDWTVASYNPLLSIHAVLNRQKWAPDNPDQRLTLEEVLVSYTRDAAYAEFQEGQKGQLKPGYLADLVLLSADIFQTPSEEIKNITPLLTMVNGRVVHEA